MQICIYSEDLAWVALNAIHSPMWVIEVKDWQPMKISQATLKSGKISVSATLSEYLSDSLFLINIGSSDYIHNYLRPDSYNTSHQYSGQDFAELLTSKLENHLKDLYNLGARKMIVFEIGPLGCLPYIINRAKASARCVDDVNRLVSVFNNKLSVKLKELGEKLDGSTNAFFPLYQVSKKRDGHVA
ncbi:GDSL esterase/lipase 7-like [Rhododendron vialii]|uniref:GDSL esterase/lipase 7-like n=1 Tax=Rhododendron vialii TaxID=182163 RepID=UPI00265EE676|nr:GDSL esterase/lipase 7-like [Rhododendron vialii]